MNGQLSDHPLAELIRETSKAGLSGALRLGQQRAKVVIYFDQGNLHYATSNLRAHRLVEVLQRTRIASEAQLAEVRAADSDRDLEATLLRRGTVTSETLDRVRSEQVTDILRTALLWTEGSWSFDLRARVAEGISVALDLDQLLMECARHLPDEYVASRFKETNNIFSRPANEVNGADLSLIEGFVLSRVEQPTTLAELTALSGVPEPDAFRAIYALALGGLLEHSGRPETFSRDLAKLSLSQASAQRKADTKAAGAQKQTAATAEAMELKEFFDRLSRASDHYEVLDLGRGVSGEEVKSAYHALARRFHPDHFHQSDAELRARVDSAFARIAQAYETLSDASMRAAYEAKLNARASAISRQSGTGHPSGTMGERPPQSNTERAEAAFLQGLEGMKANQMDKATSCFAEAARLAPRVARYRAHYGHSLGSQLQTRRVAETELKAALALEPANARYRIMLAELYKNHGMRRRALGELERALMTEPKNKAARAMLAGLQQDSNGK